MPRRRPILAACALPLALGALSACSGAKAAAAPASTAAAAAASATPSSVAVADSKALILDLGRAGHTCTAAGGANTIDMPGLRSSLNCVIADAGGTGSADATVAVFDDHADAAAFATTLTSTNVSGLLLGGSAERAVLGSNWVVLVPDDASYADAVRAALGGTVLNGGSATVTAVPSGSG